jgi:O-antigen/teichoic acid export membrane protein
MGMREIGRDLDRRGTALLAGQLAAGLITAAVAVVLARGLGSTAYGQFALISTSVYFVAQVIDVRIFEAAVRFGSDHIAAGRPLQARGVLELGLVLNLCGGLVATGLIVLASALIADGLLGDADLTGPLVLYGFVAPMSGLQGASYAVLRVLDRFRRLATLTAAAAALRLAAAAGVMLLGGGLRSVLVALLAAEAINAIAMTAIAMRTIDSRLPSSLRFVDHARAIRSAWPRMARFLAASNATGTLRIVNTQADVLLVGLLASPAAAGVLKIARVYTTPLVMPALPYAQALLPQLMEAVSLGELERFHRLTRAAGRALARVLVPAAAAIAVTAPFTVPLLFGPGYGQAPLTILPLAIAAAIGGGLFWLQPAAVVLDLQTTSLRYLAAAPVVQVAVLLVAVPALGPPGAGVAAIALVLTWAALLLPAVQLRLARFATSATAAARIR